MHDDAKAFGLELPDELVESSEPEHFEVFEENWEVLKFFLLVSTQWRIGMGGPTGLDHGVTLGLFSLYGVEEPKRVELFEGVRIMEDAALDAMARSAKP